MPWYNTDLDDRGRYVLGNPSPTAGYWVGDDLDFMMMNGQHRANMDNRIYYIFDKLTATKVTIAPDMAIADDAHKHDAETMFLVSTGYKLGECSHLAYQTYIELIALHHHLFGVPKQTDGYWIDATSYYDTALYDAPMSHYSQSKTIKRPNTRYSLSTRSIDGSIRGDVLTWIPKREEWLSYNDDNRTFCIDYLGNIRKWHSDIDQTETYEHILGHPYQLFHAMKRIAEGRSRWKHDKKLPWACIACAEESIGMIEINETYFFSCCGSRLCTARFTYWICTFENTCHYFKVEPYDKDGRVLSWQHYHTGKDDGVMNTYNHYRIPEIYNRNDGMVLTELDDEWD